MGTKSSQKATKETKPVDSSNQFFVVASGDQVEISELRGLRISLSTEESLNLAAWLRVIADPFGQEFNRLVEEIQKT